MAVGTVLSVQHLTKNYGAVTVFSDLSFQVNERERVALVGINGAGKSTMLRLIAGLYPPDEGTISLTRGMKITYLPQEARLDATHGIMTETMLAFADLLTLQTRIGELEQAMGSTTGAALDRLMSEYADATHRFEHEGGYTMEAEAARVLAGLGFTNEQFDTPVHQLSGGQKTRVALAKALLGSPDLLLLDEPTNHLDLEALEWLETFLRSYRHAVLVVSHDRTFLDRTTERTLDLSFGRLEDYPGGYNTYVRLRGERLERRRIEYETQQAQIAKTEDFIRRYGAGQRSKEAKGREKRLARVERLARPKEPDKLRLQIATATTSGRLVMTVDQPLTVGYEDARGNSVALMRTPELLVERGERIALVGPNGSGKSTFLKTLMREIPPLSGRFEFGTNVLVGYYAQSHEGLIPEDTVLDTVLNSRPMGEEAARTLLGKFLFEDYDVFKRVAVLSGGERSRLMLAVLTLQKANFLILDEPTNHLDILAREALEDVLNDYDGTILFVSHDRAFIDALATQTWIVADDGNGPPAYLTPYVGNYSEMRRTQERQRVTAEERATVAVAAAMKGSKATNGKGDKGSRDGAGSKTANGMHITSSNQHVPANGAAINGTHNVNGAGGVNGANGRNGTRATSNAGGTNGTHALAPRPAFDAKAYRTRQKLLAQVEARVSALEVELNRLTDAMEAATATGKTAEIAKLGTAYQNAQDELDTTYARWESLAADIETMTPAIV